MGAGREGWGPGPEQAPFSKPGLCHDSQATAGEGTEDVAGLVFYDWRNLSIEG